MTGDQKVYLSIALEMRERAEWLIPYLFGEANFLKPPLQYWATLAGWSVFGLGLFGALFPSVLALVGCSFLVGRIRNTDSWIPMIFFGSTLASMTYGTTAQMEVWVVFFYLLAWFLALKGRLGTAFVAVGVLSWVKGPLYPVLWGVSWILYQFLEGRSKEVLSLRFFGKALLGVAVGLSWFVAAAAKFPDEVMGVFFRRENLEKLNTSQGTAFGLWAEFLGTLFPLLPWLLVSIGDASVR
jgi:4-amino-4-deoxy-L-arabinose transferase-like glycosyltransferase